MEHCVYHAYVMHAVLSFAEDVHQPRHLRRLDLSMVLKATGAVETER